MSEAAWARDEALVRWVGFSTMINVRFIRYPKVFIVMFAHIRHVLQHPVSSFCFELKLLDLKHISNGGRTLEFRGQPSVGPPSRPIRQIHCYNHVDLHTKGLNPKLC